MLDIQMTIHVSKMKVSEEKRGIVRSHERCGGHNVTW